MGRCRTANFYRTSGKSSFASGADWTTGLSAPIVSDVFLALKQTNPYFKKTIFSWKKLLIYLIWFVFIKIISSELKKKILFVYRHVDTNYQLELSPNLIHFIYEFTSNFYLPCPFLCLLLPLDGFVRGPQFLLYVYNSNDPFHSQWPVILTWSTLQLQLLFVSAPFSFSFIPWFD